MDLKSTLVALLLAGFLAVAFMRARGPVTPGQPLRLGDLLRLPNRIERLRRSRWQWFTLVGFALVLRLQNQLPIAMELMIALEFALFLALPVRSKTVAPAR